MQASPKRARHVSTDGNLERVSSELIPTVVDYCLTHGLVVADVDRKEDASRSSQCPISMLPFKTPAEPFHHASSLSPLWNKLVDKIARDPDWLYSTLEDVLAVDPFTKRLADVCKEVHRGGLRQKNYLGIHRSDYMLSEPEGESNTRFLQVELNTIASSMAAHAANVAELHSFVLERFAGENDDVATTLRQHLGVEGESASDFLGKLPSNPVLDKIPGALAKAHDVYRTQGADGAVVLMIIDQRERNFADQRWLEWALWKKHKVKMIRRNFQQVAEDGTLDEATGQLRIGSYEISVVYYRYGYGPDNYDGDVGWSARLKMEKSLAIKCPSVAYQLVGTKKVQQALAVPGALERFMSPGESKQLRTCFAGLWGLGPGQDDEGIIAEVVKDPNMYVLKPQREGGGYNFYGKDVADKLQKMSKLERGEYILMERIVPKPQKAILTRCGKPAVGQCVSEFGFYSVFVGDGSTTHLSEHGGHLVRSKFDGVDEGGVAAGYAVISSPFLYS